uniref:Uncharacterized protein n=1 Tax=Picea glauca TaxID=3330 RepID=A0A101LZE8_PICGL|nr:hypothetical protein ABT39_MTgene5101 [Picea glauca]QHR87729.1 hypothetical protein Q903MT_gene1741 [Picea sitchensis]
MLVAQTLMDQQNIEPLLVVFNQRVRLVPLNQWVILSWTFEQARML